MDLPINSMVFFHSFLWAFTRGYPIVIWCLSHQGILKFQRWRSIAPTAARLLATWSVKQTGSYGKSPWCGVNCRKGAIVHSYVVLAEFRSVKIWLAQNSTRVDTGWEALIELSNLFGEFTCYQPLCAQVCSCWAPWCKFSSPKTMSHLHFCQGHISSHFLNMFDGSIMLNPPSFKLFMW